MMVLNARAEKLLTAGLEEKRTQCISTANTAMQKGRRTDESCQLNHISDSSKPIPYKNPSDGVEAIAR